MRSHHGLDTEPDAPELLRRSGIREHAALLVEESRFCGSRDPNRVLPAREPPVGTHAAHLSSGLMGEGPHVERNRSAMPAVVLLAIGAVVAVGALVGLLAWLA